MLVILGVMLKIMIIFLLLQVLIIWNIEYICV